MKYLNALFIIEGVGNQKISLLLNHFSSAEKAWGASFKELTAAGISENLAKTIVEKRNSIDPDEQWKILEKEKISIITINDESYPQLLAQIPTPPYLLYVKGNVDCLKLPMISIVGSRKFTYYGKQAGSNLAKELSRAGICVVSGLALGIDAIAHQGALDANSPTIAVLGNSLDSASISPRSNFFLAEKIVADGGLLVSEFPVPTAPTVGTFPARNRIIAGLSAGTLVIEAAEKSGSLITANFALEFNREIFAVPGSIFSTQSEGTNNLIRKGAKIAASVNDILEELRFQPGINTEQKEQEIELNEEEKLIIHVLSPEPTHIDIIRKQTKLDTSTISGILTILEIKGAIKNIGGQNYIRI